MMPEDVVQGKSCPDDVVGPVMRQQVGLVDPEDLADPCDGGVEERPSECRLHWFRI